MQGRSCTRWEPALAREFGAHHTIEVEREHLLQKMHTHTLPPEEAGRALQMLAREVPGEEAIHTAPIT